MTSVLICGTSAPISESRRYLMNTAADDGLMVCASGSLFGITICTRATSTPSIFESVDDNSCEVP
jgi:hypothetical protein